MAEFPNIGPNGERLAKWTLAVRCPADRVNVHWVPVGYAESDLSDANLVTCMPLDVVNAPDGLKTVFDMLVQYLALELAHVRLGVPREHLRQPVILPSSPHEPGHA